MRHKNRERTTPVDERIAQYLERASELEALRFWSSSKSAGYHIEWTAEPERLVFEAREPHHEELRAFLMTLRHFLGDREPTQFLRVSSDCRRHFTSAEGRNAVDFLRRAWRETMEKPSIEHSGEIHFKLSQGDLLDLWLNGEYFHSNPEKRARLELIDHPELPLDRMRLHLVVAELGRIILGLGAIIRQGLAKGDSDAVAVPKQFRRRS